MHTGEIPLEAPRILQGQAGRETLILFGLRKKLPFKVLIWKKKIDLKGKFGSLSVLTKATLRS